METAGRATVSVGMCIGGRDITEPRLDPTGALVAMVVAWGTSSAIVTVPVGGGLERVVTTLPPPARGRGFGGGCFDWVPDGSALVYAGTDGGLWYQPLPGGPARPVGAADADRPAQCPTVSPAGDMVAYVVDQAEVWLVALDGGARRRLDAGADAFCLDPAWAADGSAVTWHAWSPPHMPWDESRLMVSALHASPSCVRGAPGVQVQQPHHAPDGALVHLCDASGWLNLWRDGAPLVAEQCEHGGPTWGPGQRSFAVSPDGREVAFTRNEGGFGRLCVAGRDGRVRDLARGVHGQLSWRRGTISALRSGARTPTQVVAYDAGTGARRVLAVGPVDGWEAVEPPEPELVEWAGEPGGALPGRLYRSPRPRGLIVWVHGGPTDQWPVTFMARHLYWLSRGWSVLVPDPRGSTGHGRAFTQVLTGRWGDLDASDVASALRTAAAHRKDWAGAGPVVVMGSSSGGLAVLNAIARAPGLAAGAVVASPVSDLVTLDDVTHRFEAHYTTILAGPPDDPRRRERSPLHHPEPLVGTPLLILHGDQDPVVPVDHSRRLAAAVARAGGDVRLVVYEGEGHGFRRAENQADEFAQVAAFLDRLGG